MSLARNRLRRIESSLSPREAVIHWLKAQQHAGTLMPCLREVLIEKKPPVETRLMDQVEEALLEAMKGQPELTISQAVVQARGEIAFLVGLALDTNFRVWEQTDRAWELTQLATEIADQAIVRTETQQVVEFLGLDTALPMDAPTAGAIEAAIRWRVVNREILEWTLVGWVREHLIRQGKAELPLGADAYRTENPLNEQEDARIFLGCPSKEELRNLFLDEAAFQDFLVGKDFSWGLADARDETCEKLYVSVQTAWEELVECGAIEKGTTVRIPPVPLHFVRDVPLVEGEWIDRAVLELAEGGALLKEKGFRIQSTEDDHPLAWDIIYLPRTDGCETKEASFDEVEDVLLQARKNLARFKGRTKKIGGRDYLHFEDYCKWPHRKTRGNLKATDSIEQGVVAESWNAWVESKGGPGKAELAGVKVGRIDPDVDRSTFVVVETPRAAYEKRSKRNGVICLLRRLMRNIAEFSKPTHRHDADTNESSLAHLSRVRSWRARAITLSAEIYTTKLAVEAIEKRYFDGHGILFGTPAELLKLNIVILEHVIKLYNEVICPCYGLRMDNKRAAAAKTQDSGNFAALFQSGGRIDLGEIKRRVQPHVTKRVEEHVDLAKATTLTRLGRGDEARDLLAKHLDADGFFSGSSQFHCP